MTHENQDPENQHEAQHEHVSVRVVVTVFVLSSVLSHSSLAHRTMAQDVRLFVSFHPMVIDFGGCVCASRGERVRLAICLRCLDLWSTIAGLVHCPLGFYGTFGFLSSSRSLQVYSWPVFLCWLVNTFAP